MVNTIEDIFYDLVNIRSDTGTTLERNVESYIYNWLSGLDYFITNPNNYGRYKLPTDHLEREIIWGLVKGKGKDTVILMHHHDVVDPYDYGGLMADAYNPKELKNKLKAMVHSEEVKKDLESEAWIFGRGTADMKAGAAIQLTLLESYSKIENFQGNVLLISVPDEESLSKGMREAIKLLKELKESCNLNYKIMINSEPHQREQAETGLIFTGSVGKIMPLVYVAGKKTHIGDSFQGLNPIMVLSQIAGKIELNPDFCDRVEGEVSPPPTWSNFRDRKEQYDASIPESAAGYFSILTLKRSPKEILEAIKDISREAFQNTIGVAQDNYTRFRDKMGKPTEMLPWKVSVKTFEEIYKDALRDYGQPFIDDYHKTIEKIRVDLLNNKLNLPEANFILIEKVLQYRKNQSPIVVIGVSPPYYPHVSNRELGGVSEDILNICKWVHQFTARTWDESYEEGYYFMGISDMSYTSINNKENSIPYIVPNMPLWGTLYDIDFDTMAKLAIPSINIGPWGKDLHKFTERVYKRDLLERTPAIIDFTIKKLLETE